MENLNKIIQNIRSNREQSDDLGLNDTLLNIDGLVEKRRLHNWRKNMMMSSFALVASALAVFYFADKTVDNNTINNTTQIIQEKKDEVVESIKNTIETLDKSDATEKEEVADKPNEVTYGYKYDANGIPIGYGPIEQINNKISQDKAHNVKEACQTKVITTKTIELSAKEAEELGIIETTDGLKLMVHQKTFAPMKVEFCNSCVNKVKYVNAEKPAVTTIEPKLVTDKHGNKILSLFSEGNTNIIVSEMNDGSNRSYSDTREVLDENSDKSSKMKVKKVTLYNHKYDENGNAVKYRTESDKKIITTEQPVNEEIIVTKEEDLKDGTSDVIENNKRVVIVNNASINTSAIDVNKALAKINLDSIINAAQEQVKNANIQVQKANFDNYRKDIEKYKGNLKQYFDMNNINIDFDITVDTVSCFPNEASNGKTEKEVANVKILSSSNTYNFDDLDKTIVQLDDYTKNFEQALDNKSFQDYIKKVKQDTNQIKFFNNYNNFISKLRDKNFDRTKLIPTLDLNKMLAIKVIKGQDEYIFWYENSSEVLDKLPKDKIEDLSKELEILSNGKSVCEADIDKSKAILDVWKGCSANLNEMKVYPNPAVNQFNIDFTSSKVANCNIYIADLTGKNLQTLNGSYSTTVGMNSLNFNVNNLTSGMYYVIIESEFGDIIQQRLIIK